MNSMPRLPASVRFLLILLLSAAGLQLGSAGETPWPLTALTNGKLRLTVAPPDRASGFYRSTRYDWGGMVLKAEVEGHQFLAQFRDPQNPLDPNHAGGTAEEFSQDDPPGYKQAKAGEEFLKPGVGLLRRVDDSPYGFQKAYVITNGGEWLTEPIPHGLRFTQNLQSATGWAYQYEKTIVLDPAKAAFVIARRLRNLGQRQIDTVHYSHHFLRFDDREIGPGYELTLPTVLSPLEPQPITITGRQFRPSETVSKAFLVRFASPAVAAPARFSIGHAHVGTAMHVEVDAPLSDFRVYLEDRILCPEPFVKIAVAPGAEFKWETRYRFSKTVPR